MLDSIIVGTGMSGMLAAIKLKEAGLNNFVMLERATSLGGTWQSNTYPGCACDVPSHLYSYSFEPNPNWTRVYPLQAEILAYFKQVADKYSLLPHMRFNCEIASAEYESATGSWRVTTRGGEHHHARTLIFGTGQLSKPSIPHFAGIETFKGKVFHSAHWEHGHDLTGKRVAVIGNGPSAVQFIPEIAPLVKQLIVLQRTANWFVPRLDRPYKPWEQWAFKHVPGYRAFTRARIYLRNELVFQAFRQGSFLARKLLRDSQNVITTQVPDATLRAKLMPNYPVGCKRVVVSSNYLPAMALPNVVLETAAIERVTDSGIVLKNGTEHSVDTIIYGTGFEATEFLAPIVVRGQHQLLSETWRDGAEAFQGTTVAGFPNMFILYGPNTNLGHNSIIFMVEQQVAHALQLIKSLLDGNHRAISVKPDVMRRYNVKLQEALNRSVWKAGCRNWYMNSAGKVTANWPASSIAWRRRLRQSRTDDFEFT
jgi:cation diffusion facilitator CzcD-associated flavoprotein CzcO